MLKVRYLAFLFLLCASLGIITGDHNHLSLHWTGGSFQFPCPSTKSLYRSSGKYTPKNVIATRAQLLDNDVFVAFPRYKKGTPATLAKATHRLGHSEIKFEPFPSWQMQEEEGGNCKNLQSVVDLFLDRNHILWVLDTGIIRTLSEPERRCPPKILAFNARTGKLLRTIILTSLVNSRSRLQYLVVEYASHENDDRVYIYITDAANRALLAYDVQACRGYRLMLPKAVTVGGCKKDVLYISLVKRSCGSSILYFTYLGSTHMFAIKTEYLQTGNTAGRITDIGVKKDRMIIVGTDNGSSIFFRYEGDSDVYQYDTNKCFKEESFKVVHRGPSCLLATHAFPDYRHGRMRVLESNFPDFMNGHVGCGAVQQINTMEGCG